MFEKVLFPTDFSEYAKKTLNCIGEIAGTKEAVLLHLVNAMHPSKRGLAQSPHIEKYLSYAIIMITIQGLIFETEIF